MRTVVIEIHSLNKNQINKKDVPYLFSLSKKYGLGRIKPCFGYDIQTCFWTGANPKESNLFAKYEYHKEFDKFDFIHLFPKKIKTVLFNLRRYINGNDFFTALCNHRLAKHFTIARNYHFFHKNAFIKPTMFDILRKNDKKFLYYQWPILATNHWFKFKFFPRLDDIGISNAFIGLLGKNKGCDFYFLQLRDLDMYSHKYGPYSKEAKERQGRIDSSIKSILNNFSFEEDNIVLFSYFGMVPVTRVIDLESKLPKFGEGYVYFLDSTMARFWFFDKRVKKQVIRALSKSKGGHLLSRKDKIKYSANFKDNRHFEEIFVLNPGTIINPCFFHEDPIKGAHCYSLNASEEMGILISNKPIKKRIGLNSLLPELLRLMKIKNTNDGKK